MTRFYRIYFAITLGGLLFLAASALGVVHWHCPSRYILSLPCPGCGLTRGLLAALSFHPLQALRLNWLSLPIAVGWGATLIVALCDVATHRTRLQQACLRAESFLRAHCEAAVGIALALYLLSICR